MKQNIVILVFVFNSITFAFAGSTISPPVYDSIYYSDSKTNQSVALQEIIINKDAEKINIIPENERRVKRFASRNHFSFGLSSGPGYLAGSIKDAKASFVSKGLDKKQVDSFFRQLRVGITGDLNFHYMIFRDYGAGVNVLFFNTGADEQISYNPSGKNVLLEGNWHKKTHVSYFGPSLIAEKFLSKQSKWKISAAISAGMAMCQDYNAYLGSNVDLSGKAVAATGSLGMNYRLTRNLFLDFKANVLASHLNKVKVRYDTYTRTYDLRKEKIEGISIENLSVADVSAGMKISF